MKRSKETRATWAFGNAVMILLWLADKKYYWYGEMRDGLIFCAIKFRIPIKCTFTQNNIILFAVCSIMDKTSWATCPIHTILHFIQQIIIVFALPLWQEIHMTRKSIRPRMKKIDLLVFWWLECIKIFFWFAHSHPRKFSLIHFNNMQIAIHVQKMYVQWNNHIWENFLILECDKTWYSLLWLLTNQFSLSSLP